MAANILIGSVIFGYAGWAMFRHIKKSKQGQCASYGAKSSCSNKCSD